MLTEKTTSNRHPDIFLGINHDICKIKLTLRYFSYIYISYQMYKTRSCWTFYHSLNRLPQGSDNRVSTSWKWFNMEVYARFTWFHFKLDLWIFKKKTLVKRKRFAKKNPEKLWKCSGKTKKFQSHLSCSRPFET